MFRRVLASASTPRGTRRFLLPMVKGVGGRDVELMRRAEGRGRENVASEMVDDEVGPAKPFTCAQSMRKERGHSA